MHRTLVLTRLLFIAAGLYGLAVMVPALFLEDFIGRTDPPAITHPEYYYGFVGVVLSWQVMFLILATDPLRYRPMMIPAILEKLGYGVAALVLFTQGRISGGPFFGGVVDLAWAALFVSAYAALRRQATHY